MLSRLIDIQLPSNNLHVTQLDKYAEHVIVEFSATLYKMPQQCYNCIKQGEPKQLPLLVSLQSAI